MVTLWRGPTASMGLESGVLIEVVHWVIRCISLIPLFSCGSRCLDNSRPSIKQTVESWVEGSAVQARSRSTLDYKNVDWGPLIFGFHSSYEHAKPSSAFDMPFVTIHRVALLATALFATTFAAPAREQVSAQLSPAQSPARADFLWPRSLTDTGSSFGISQNVQTATSILRQYSDWTVLVAKYPQGSYAGADIAGFIFDAATNIDLSNAKEVILSYDIEFVSGFAWALGGKIPGLCTLPPIDLDFS